MSAQVQRNRGFKIHTCQTHVSLTQYIIIPDISTYQTCFNSLQHTQTHIKTSPFKPSNKGPLVVKTIYSRLHLCWPSSHIAHSVLPPHCATMCNFNLQPLDFFGELDPLGICQRFTLLVYIPYVQNFTHEFNHRLRLIKGRCRNCQQNVYAIYYS